MSAIELPKTFDSKAAEERWFQLWIDRGYFKADPSRDGLVFSIVIPPPNVTGQLHLGHALNVSLQDIIVRTRRMQGYNTLWLPGTDHAGIATQNAVEKMLAKDGKNRHQMGRDAFVERVWQWRNEYGDRILHQLRRLGASCDWSRERFTLDPGLSRAVTKAFVDLYNKQLIYRDKRLINWCPRCETALSDLEVDHKEQKGHLWYIRYPYADGSGSITVATTRPETMLGDTAVAVNPDDGRYKSAVGKPLKLPLTNREIEIVADAAVDSAFGTGAVKITPGHDFNDFELGKRHGLEQISIFDNQARMNANAGPYQGLSREAARKKIVADLEAQELLEKIEPHANAVGVCSRCDTIVEPMLSEQWFLSMKKMAERAAKAVREGETTFHPKFWENTFFNWMDNIHDWCISRQLWWGHRIPAYRCARCDELVVAMERPAQCAKCGGSDIIQDDDVLDTWFSSGLWPFSTMGWPDDTPELQRYYPTSLLLTGFDIIFFWVARMMMFGLEFTDQVPFKDVYITPLVRDQYGKKMTKSKGNVVDPLDLMEQYGADAVRFTLAQLAAQGRDVILSHDRFAASRAFANKIWNAARFVMMNLEGAPQPLEAVPQSDLSLADRWILNRLDLAIREVTTEIDNYEFNVAALHIYVFAWYQFCDRYIELVKEPLRAGGKEQAAARWTLAFAFDNLLRLLHPFMPFVTEEVWHAIHAYLGEENLAPHLPVAKFPEFRRNLREIAALRRGGQLVPSPTVTSSLSPGEGRATTFCFLIADAINSQRALLAFHPGQRASVLVTPPSSERKAFASTFSLWKSYAMTLGRAESLDLIDDARPGRTWVPSHLPEGCVVWVKAPEDFNFTKKRESLKKDLEEVTIRIQADRAKLENSGFAAKASPEIQAEIAQRIGTNGALKLRLEQDLESLRELGERE
ncbi:MAG: valine--tRNA ligase [Candidatus Binataceae bacterium]